MANLKKAAAIAGGAAGTIGWETGWDKYYTTLRSVLSNDFNAAYIKIGKIASKSKLDGIPHLEVGIGPDNPNLLRDLRPIEYFVRDVVAHPVFEGFVKALPFIVMGVYGAYAFKKHRDAKSLEKREEFAENFTKKYGGLHPEGKEGAYVDACNAWDKYKERVKSEKHAKKIFNDISKTLAKISPFAYET
ncbi:MAG: hypothetical protein GTN36_06290 [Candidatus Aenigmarchaeota archaeon]|nr:hypothetical protein [Candidatus Aenigmarchaeota archaeon]